MNENYELNDANNEQDVIDFFNNNPLLKLAKETCQQEDELIDIQVEEILNNIKAKVDSKEISIKTAILTLSKCIGYCAQAFMKNEDEFFNEKEIANKLVITNLYPALGAYADNEELNKTGEVEFKGQLDESNFTFKRMILLGVSLIEYTNWKIHLSNASKVLEKKAEDNEEENN